MVTAARKAQAAAPKPNTPKPVAGGKSTAKATQVKPRTEASAKPKAEPARTAAAKEVLPYATALSEYRDLKKAVSDDFSRLCYDARLKEPKNSKTPEEATAKVESIVAAYREFARVLASAAPKRV